MNKTDRQVRRLERFLGRSKVRTVLFMGLAWGWTTALLIPWVEGLLELDFSIESMEARYFSLEMLIRMIVFSIAGPLWALWVWQIATRKYKKLVSRQQVESAGSASV
jgi:hypothetical protein